jgi:hypothetical protein
MKLGKTGSSTAYFSFTTVTGARQLMGWSSHLTDQTTRALLPRPHCDGAVTKIIETEREREPSLSRDFYHQLESMFQDDKPVIDLSDPEVGAEMYVLWGSIDRKLDGYPAKLTAKTSRDWAFTVRNQKIETIDPHQLGNCLFHSEADAKAQRTWEHRLWDRKTQYCKDVRLKNTQHAGVTIV